MIENRPNSMSFRKENLDFKMEHSPDTKNLNLGLNAYKERQHPKSKYSLKHTE